MHVYDIYHVKSQKRAYSNPCLSRTLKVGLHFYLTRGELQPQSLYFSLCFPVMLHFYLTRGELKFKFTLDYLVSIPLA